jgi:hypothetical protein
MDSRWTIGEGQDRATAGAVDPATAMEVDQDTAGPVDPDTGTAVPATAMVAAVGSRRWCQFGSRQQSVEGNSTGFAVNVLMTAERSVVQTN